MIQVRTRPRERNDPDYVREETYVERGKGSGPRGELVYRGRDDSIEDIPRDFPPPGRSRHSSHRDYDDSASTRRTKSAAPRYSDDYDDDRHTQYSGRTGSGTTRRRDRDSRHRRDDRDYDSENSDSPPPRDRHKSGVSEVIDGLGLGGIAGALLGQKNKARSESRGPRSARSRSRRGGRHGDSDDDRRSRSRGGDRAKTERKWAQAAQSALVAGAIEAFRSRNEPGTWTGAKGKRVATAAIGAGGVNGLIDRDPEKKTKRHLVEAVVGGLAANRLANGPRSKSRGRDDRDLSPDARPRSRSRSRSIIDKFRGRSQSRGRNRSDEEGGGGAGALKGLAAGGALAAAGKAIYDRVRSKSRQKRSPSNSSADSYVPSRNRRQNRRRSPPSDTDNNRQTGGATDRGIDNNDNDNDNDNGGGDEGNSGALAKSGGAGGGAQDKGKEDSDSSSTTDMENKRKKMRGKELLTAGLATIATIHAAHGVYSSMESHQKRHRLVAEGEMTPEEARKKQTKAWIQDAAAVGIAALGIKGAFSEWKEMTEHRYIISLASILSNKLRTLLTIALSLGVKSMVSKNASAIVARRWNFVRSKKRMRGVSE